MKVTETSVGTFKPISFVTTIENEEDLKAIRDLTYSPYTHTSKVTNLLYDSAADHPLAKWWLAIQVMLKERGIQ